MLYLSGLIYCKLIEDLRWYEKQYDMIVLDDYYEYDKI